MAPPKYSRSIDMPPRKKKVTVKKNPVAQHKVSVSSRRLLEIVNVSNSDFELIINGENGISVFWMTPQKSILVPYRPQTPQLEEYKRRKMVSVTEIQR